MSSPDGSEQGVVCLRGEVGEGTLGVLPLQSKSPVNEASCFDCDWSASGR